MIKILIVDDEKPICDLIDLNLSAAGYFCKSVQDGMKAIELIEKETFDLILLDIMLPGVDGFDIMEYIRPLKIPVIFITAKGDVKDRVKGLRLGAEDYLVKPFDVVELLARVEVVLRRFHKRGAQLSAGDVVVDMEARMVMKAGVPVVLTNKEYGLLGANKSTEDSVKLFPRDSFKFANDLQERFKEATGKNVEVLVYGDGAFKDSVGQIWELADPVVSPGYTKGLEGVPNELKLKYLADNDFKDLKGDELNNAILEKIKHKYDENAVHNENEKLGTTPRKLTDLIGSLCDLTSGSGDKGTPIILIQGYFDNLATE